MKRIKLFIVTLFCCLTVLLCHAQNGSTLYSEFLSPPPQYKPRTWMHAMSGNMSKEGFTKDLESIKKVGIGGVLLFNITQGIPFGPVKYNSKEHHEIIQHAIKEADRLGLTFGVHNCDGWSSSGGPWVTPQDAMKMIVYTEHIIEGGTKQNVKLTKPTSRNGFYQDIAVLAYPSLTGELMDASNRPKLSCSSKDFPLDKVFNEVESGIHSLPMDGKNTPWIQLEYTKAVEVKSINMLFEDRNGECTLQTSDDGITFKDAKKLMTARTGKSEWAINDNFTSIKSKYFRLAFNQQMGLKKIKVSSQHLIDQYLGKTSIARIENDNFKSGSEPTSEHIIDPFSIKVLTKNLDGANTINTDLPAGKWTLLRVGYTTTGAVNMPSSPEGKGLEVEKISRAPLLNHFNQFVQKIADESKASGYKSFRYSEIDSYEMGGENWTINLDQIIKEKKQFDIIPLLPLFAGKYVESVQTSEAVLSDFRNVISDLMVTNYFKYFTELCHKAGIESYVEPYGMGPFNFLDAGGTTDIPMGEFWMARPNTMVTPAVSAARIYGKPVISAESFTATQEINWSGAPVLAKTSGDRAWIEGINEFMFHRFVHQPNTNVTPGMTMNRWGFHFDRNQTWWESAGKAWFNYMARGQRLLREGNPVSDVLVFVGDSAPTGTYTKNDFKPAIPSTINFDNVNGDVLLNRVTTKDGKLTLPEGTSYTVLALKNSQKMTLATLQKLVELANAGIKIVGEKPEIQDGFVISSTDRLKFEELKNVLLPKIEPVTNWESLVKGKEGALDFEVIKGANIDFIHRKSSNEDIYFIYNPDTVSTTYELCFRINDRVPELWDALDGSKKKLANFTQNKATTLFKLKLEAGQSTFVVFQEKTNPNLIVSSEDEELDFVVEKGEVFAITSKEKPISYIKNGKSKKVIVKHIDEPKLIQGPWKLAFSAQDSDHHVLDTLVDWKDHPLDRIKYYSGTGTYTNSFTVSNKAKLRENKYELDLGKVYISARIIVNGKEVGILFYPPYAIDISPYIKVGNNEVKIEVTNQWANKLIGDERYPQNYDGYKLNNGNNVVDNMVDWYVKNEPRPAGQRTTFSTADFYKKGDALYPSGLLGPVVIRTYKKLKLK